jgi:hypothetical protein
LSNMEGAEGIFYVSTKIKGKGLADEELRN